MFFIENILFWGFVYLIVFLGCETPSIVFTGFGLFLFYWIGRSLVQSKGGNFLLGLYAFNMFICILLLYYFITGNSYQKLFRNVMNSTIRRFPSAEPYLKRC